MSRNMCGLLLQTVKHGLSVCLLDTFVSQNGWTDRDAVWATGSHWYKKPCVRWDATSN